MFTFEWDDEKAARNLRKHGVSFDEAVSVFGGMSIRGGYWWSSTQCAAVTFESSAHEGNSA